MLTILKTLQQEKIISHLDFYFAQFIANHQQHNQPQYNLVLLVAALLSYAQQKGDSCIYLTSSLVDNPFDLTYRSEHSIYIQKIQQAINFLPLDQWQEVLLKHIAVSQDTSKPAPLLIQHYHTADNNLSQSALYFYRVWQDEHCVARRFSQVAEHTPNRETQQQIATIIHKLFDLTDSSQTNWQAIAVATAMTKPISLISGGPGTGKTYTVTRLLIALQWLAHQQQQNELKIKLVAPTGKAAARLQESLTHAFTELVKQQEIFNDFTPHLPAQPSTIHRLLKLRPNSRPTFNQDNPLNIDILVIDEASMIDLSLMATLFQALPAKTKVILLGDKDQLASVESGAIVGELAYFLTQDYSQTHANYIHNVSQQMLSVQANGVAIRDSLCHLKTSFRFNQHSGIGHLAKAINAQASQKSWQLFSQYDDIHLLQYTLSKTDRHAFIDHNLAQILHCAEQAYRPYLTLCQQLNRRFSLALIQDIFLVFKQVRLLAALRNGKFGVEQLNLNIAEKLQKQGLIHFKHPYDWYLGKPIMITHNDMNIGLSNGDIGLVLPDKQGLLKVWFELDNQLVSFATSRIPQYEVAYAMTVHKSQGSEFEHTIIVLPDEPSPILTKELLYTAVTRAKQKITLFSHENVWKSAVRSQVNRQSGLSKQITALSKLNEL